MKKKAILVSSLALLITGAASASFFGSSSDPAVPFSVQTAPVTAPTLPSSGIFNSFFSLRNVSETPQTASGISFFGQSFQKNSLSAGSVSNTDGIVGYKSAMTTVFWVGEGATPSNNYIQNSDSAWDSDWEEHYGGIDGGNSRCGYRPCGFVPRENPFYFALPYNDLAESGERKASAYSVPWFSSRKDSVSVLKNSWIEIAYNGRICYAQWEDVGPNEEDDFAYVFGMASPRNNFGVRAGLDISPAVKDCLGLSDNAVTQWKFIPDSSVPNGPWKDIITTRGVSW